MDIQKAKIVSDLRLYEVRAVSRELGRKRLRELEGRGVINPLRTPTGRTLLSFEETELLSAAL